MERIQVIATRKQLADSKVIRAGESFSVTAEQLRAFQRLKRVSVVGEEAPAPRQKRTYRRRDMVAE